MKTIRIICRIFIGLLFIFSGYVKAIDPVGSQIIFTEYFKAFHVSFFIPIALLFGVLLSTAEMLIGLCALLGVRMKETAWATLLFMVFFTILTLILAIFNPVTDCGCFGEAIKLTNWETFFKNVVFMVFTLGMFWQRKNYKSFASCRTEWITAGVLVLIPLILSIYSYRHLPLIDFMSYKVGANITEVKNDSKPDVYDTFLYYEKDGKTEQFTLENYPQDQSWTFVETKTLLKEKGYESPMVDFTIATLDGEYVTDSILNLPGYVFLLTLPHAEKASIKQAAQINALADYCLTQPDMHFFALTGSVDEQIEQFVLKTGAMYPFYNTDEKPLMSMVRANPGLMVLHKATVLAKWNHRDIPAPEDVQKTIGAASNEKIIAKHATCEQRTTDILALIIFAGMGLWGWMVRKNAKRSIKTDDIL
jgi:uncharacterized membrane protein YphA (DoxX/SURF4 family)